MSGPDTSAATVEEMAAAHERDAERFAPSMPGKHFRRDTAALLRALAAERDAAVRVCAEARDGFLVIVDMCRDMEGYANIAVTAMNAAERAARGGDDV